MKQSILMVSLILLGSISIRDNYKEQPNLADPNNPLSLTCPEYSSSQSTINANPNFAAPDAGTKGIDQNWYSSAVEYLIQEEYNITYSDEVNSYQSPNRANNLRFIYHKDGFTAGPRQSRIPLFDVNDRNLRDEEKKYEEIEEWSVELRLECGGTDALGLMNVNDNRAWIECGNIRIDYANTKEGMRQDFIIKNKPANAGNLVLVMNANTDLNLTVSKDAVKFGSANGEAKMQYASLKAFDATGKTLEAYFEKRSDEQFAIVVDDSDAEYPVTVDPLSIAPDWTAHGTGRFGWSLSDAGDVNGDGFDDVMIGDPSFENSTGRGKIFIYFGSADGLPNSESQFLSGSNDRGLFGESISSAGDVNADGFDDIIVLTKTWGNGPSEVSVFHGSTNGLIESPAWSIESSDTGVCFVGGDPESLGSGDFNGDGIYDVVIGTGEACLYQSHYVGAYIFFGSVQGISGNQPAWTAPANQNEIPVFFGWTVAGAGDLNGDGFDDVIVGAPFDGDSGKILVYYGSPVRGIFDPPDWVASGEHGLQMGLSVSSAGDVNNDGFDEVIAGAPPWGSFGAGRAYIFFGSPTGLSSNNFVMLSSEPTTAGYGYSVSGVSDYNGDGFDDIVVGEGFWQGYLPPSSFLYFGNANGITAEEITLQGFIRVSDAGDVNGDGLGEIITGPSPAYVYYGRPNIISISPETAYRFLYEENYFDVSLRDPVGRPIPYTEVLVEIRGANPEILSGLSTDDSGNVEYFLIGYNSGIDTIIATASNVFDTAFVFWDDPNPVELISFTSATRSRDITLSWSTSSELNNSGFDIERKPYNKEWSKIGFVPGSGTTNEPKEYFYTDKNLETGKYNYRLKQIDFNGNFEYFELAEVVSIGIPEKYDLSQNYPNPFNPVTTINYDLPDDAFVTIKVYDILGREVKTLVNEMKTAGYHKIQFSAADLASGAYFYRLSVSGEAGEFIAVRKCVVVK